jgi:hypothetical protein
MYVVFSLCYENQHPTGARRFGNNGANWRVLFTWKHFCYLSCGMIYIWICSFIKVVPVLSLIKWHGMKMCGRVEVWFLCASPQHCVELHAQLLCILRKSLSSAHWIGTRMVHRCCGQEKNSWPCLKLKPDSLVVHLAAWVLYWLPQHLAFIIIL